MGAYGLFWSRAMRVTGKPAMVPLLDVLNHDPASKHRITSSAAPVIGATDAKRRMCTRFTLIAESRIAAGEEVVIDYGAKSNDELLLLYGFTIPSNKADRFPVRAVELFAEDDPVADEVFDFGVIDDVIPFGLLQVARTLIPKDG